VGDFGDRRVGGGGAVEDKVGIGEGGVPTLDEGRAVGQVAGVRLEEGLRAGTGDEARPKVGVQEAAAHKVGAFKSGGRARGSGVGDGREKSGVFEGKERIGKVREGFADARETGGGEEDVKATIVVGGGGEIKTSGAMLGPRLSGEGRVEGDNKLAGGMCQRSRYRLPHPRLAKSCNGTSSLINYIIYTRDRCSIYSTSCIYTIPVQVCPRHCSTG
jgi:hypothetical protein